MVAKQRLSLCCVVVVKAAQAVLITLYNLNPDEFMLMLSVLPKTFQVCLSFFYPLHFVVAC